MLSHSVPLDSVANTLARDRLGIPNLVVTVISAAAPMTVIAAGATLQWAVTGQLGIPVAYLAVAAVLTVFSVGLVDMSSHITNAGAFYAYISRGVGRYAGVGGAFVAVVAYNAMAVGMLGGAGAVASSWLSSQFRLDLPWWLCGLLCWLLVAVMGVRRIDHTGRLLAVLLGGEVLLALVLAGVQVAHPAGGALTFDALDPSALTSASGGVLLVIAITGFVGFEQTVVYAEEAKRPETTVRWATYLSVVFIGVLYGFASWAMAVAAGPDRIVAMAAEHGTELTFVLAGPYIPSFLSIVGHLLFITSLIAGYLAFHNTAARYHFSLGREGVLPAVLGSVGGRTSAPVGGSLLQSVIGVLTIAVYAIAGWDPEIYLFFWGTCIGGLGVLILMVLTSAAIPAFTLRRRHRGEQGSLVRGVVAPVIAGLLLGGILSETVRNIHIMLGLDPGDPLQWAAPVAFGVAAVAGVLWAIMLRRNRPGVFAGIGLGSSADPSLIQPVQATTGARR